MYVLCHVYIYIVIMYYIMSYVYLLYICNYATYLYRCVPHLFAGSRRGIGVNEERDQTLNQLLTELDGFEGREGVLLLAATNRAEVSCIPLPHPTPAVLFVICCNTHSLLLSQDTTVRQQRTV